MKTHLRTRAFILCFLPFSILLTSSFWMIQRFVQATVRDGLHTSLRESQIAVANIRAKGDLRNSRFLRVAGENTALKAGLNSSFKIQRAPMRAALLKTSYANSASTWDSTSCSSPRPTASRSLESHVRVLSSSRLLFQTSKEAARDSSSSMGISSRWPRFRSISTIKTLPRSRSGSSSTSLISPPR